MGIDQSLIKEEWYDIVDYSKQYLNLVQDDYKVVRWKLFNAFDSKEMKQFLGCGRIIALPSDCQWPGFFSPETHKD